MANCTGDRQVPIWAWIGFVLSCCFFSGMTGDVPDGVVYTDLHQNAQLGSRAVLKCEFYRTPLAVYWKKGDNPSTSPTLITWGQDEPDSGMCVKDKTCEMGDDYSLIIKNVSIADQGRYICRISNYMGILLHNFTDVKVLARPEEPYPIIDECNENQGGNCIFLATGPVNITCTVLKYFPNVDLFLLHGSQKYSIKDTVEWTNTDGTKSKSIFTTAPPSEIPYGCVAFNIPESQDQRTVTFKVTFQNNVTTTQAGVPIKRNKIFVVIIVVPIIAVIFIAAGILLCLMIYCRKSTGRERKDVVEATPLVSQRKIKGKISYYELWLLVRHLVLSGNAKMLSDILRQLMSVHNATEMFSAQKAYELLYKWKEDNRMDNEAEILEDTLKIVLKKKYYERAWNDVCGKRENSSIKIDSHTFEHILWNIKGLEKINEFLCKLIPGRTSIFAYTAKKAEIVQSSLKELTEWSNGQLELNPKVLLSSALERAGCRVVARTFFLVPGHLTSPLEQTEIKGIVRKLTSRHCKRLASGKFSSNEIDSTIDQNDNMLFDTSALITNWFDQLECSNYEKRCRFDDAIIKIGRYDMQDCLETILNRHSLAYHQEHLHPINAQLAWSDHESVFDDDIPQLVKLVKYIPPDKLSRFSEKTGLSVDRDDDNIGEELKKKRDDILARSTSKAASLQEFTSLRDKFKEHSEIFECIVYKSSKKFVYHAELSKIALNLLMEDVRPIIDALAMDWRKVSSYIQPVSDQVMGTKQLVMKILKSASVFDEIYRDDFCEALRKIGFVDVSRSVYFDYEPSLSELIDIFDCVGKDYMDRFLKHLDLGADDIEECRESEEQIDKLKVMRVWKRQIRPVPYHYRLEIAAALRVAGLNRIANSVLSGEHRQKMPNPDVIKDICSRLDDVTRKELCKWIEDNYGLKEETSTTLVINWVNKWMSEYCPATNLPWLPGHMAVRKSVNDKLFNAGFHELAEEISALENSQIP